MDDEGMPHDGRTPGEEVQELVTLAEIARRVVALGYAKTMSKERVSQLSKTDPAWPVPRSEWRKLGPYWQIPWAPIEEYFRTRKPVHGVHRSRAKDTNDQQSTARSDDPPGEG
jgi:hypothetical protein